MILNLRWCTNRNRLPAGGGPRLTGDAPSPSHRCSYPRTLPLLAFGYDRPVQSSAPAPPHCRRSRLCPRRPSASVPVRVPSRVLSHRQRLAAFAHLLDKDSPANMPHPTSPSRSLSPSTSPATSPATVDCSLPGQREATAAAMVTVTWQREAMAVATASGTPQWRLGILPMGRCCQRLGFPCAHSRQSHPCTRTPGRSCTGRILPLWLAANRSSCRIRGRTCRTEPRRMCRRSLRHAPSRQTRTAPDQPTSPAAVKPAKERLRQLLAAAAAASARRSWAAESARRSWAAESADTPLQGILPPVAAPGSILRRTSCPLPPAAAPGSILLRTSCPPPCRQRSEGRSRCSPCRRCTSRTHCLGLHRHTHCR